MVEFGFQDPDPIYREAVSVIGVGYDSVDKRVYWTDVKLGKETIESVTTDGHNRRVVLSTGLGMPEDLVVDETSRNIYFRSSAMSHLMTVFCFV